MSQGFIPINNPLGHPNTFAEEDSVAVSHKQEDEEEDIGDQEGDEVWFFFHFPCGALLRSKCVWVANFT